MTSIILPSVQDRTQEFRSCVASIAKINGTNKHSGVVNQPNGLTTQQQQQQQQQHAPQSSKSQFALRASQIAQEISETTSMLQRLALLAKRKTLFDDRPIEISELSFVIKQKLSKINDSIASLQSFVKNQSGNNNAWGVGNKTDVQLNEHSRNVVVLLQGKLTDVTTGFTEVLETRTKNTQATKSRTEQFISSASSSVRDHGSTESPLYSVPSRRGLSPAIDTSNAAGSVRHSDESYAENPYGQQNQHFLHDDKPNNDDFLILPQQEQTMALLEEQQDSYLSQRSSAVEAIESTIQELGGIFSQLATMVAEQRETVQRIDANTEDISLNVSGAQRELLKYYARISSNRWLMVKLFGIIIVSIALDPSLLTNSSSSSSSFGSSSLSIH